MNYDIAISGLVATMKPAQFKKFAKDIADEHERWKTLKVGQYFCIVGTYDDMFLQEIVEIDVETHTLKHMDHSIDRKPIETAHTYSKSFDTIDEAVKYYTNRYR